MSNEKKWYIIYTRAGSENKLIQLLMKRGVQVFCPMITITNENHKKVTSPLICNYIFINIKREEQAAIRQLSVPVNFMYWLDTIEEVDEEDIIVLKEITEQYKVVQAEKIKVNRTLPSSKTWISQKVLGDSVLEEEQSIIKASFPRYGFALLAKESRVHVRVVNVSTNRISNQPAYQ